MIRNLIFFLIFTWKERMLVLNFELGPKEPEIIGVKLSASYALSSSTRFRLSLSLLLYRAYEASILILWRPVSVIVKYRKYLPPGNNELLTKSVNFKTVPDFPNIGTNSKEFTDS